MAYWSPIVFNNSLQEQNWEGFVLQLSPSLYTRYRTHRWNANPRIHYQILNTPDLSFKEFTVMSMDLEMRNGDFHSLSDCTTVPSNKVWQSWTASNAREPFSRKEFKKIIKKELRPLKLRRFPLT